MINLKPAKWGFAIVLSVGLSACMDMNHSNEPVYPQHVPQVDNQIKHKQQPVSSTHSVNKGKIQKTYASKDPTQKSTPGPTRKAAPQIPVIQ